MNAVLLDETIVGSIPPFQLFKIWIQKDKSTSYTSDQWVNNSTDMPSIKNHQSHHPNGCGSLFRGPPSPKGLSKEPVNIYLSTQGIPDENLVINMELVRPRNNSSWTQNGRICSIRSLEDDKFFRDGIFFLGAMLVFGCHFSRAVETQGFYKGHEVQRYTS